MKILFATVAFLACAGAAKAQDAGFSPSFADSGGILLEIPTPLLLSDPISLDLPPPPLGLWLVLEQGPGGHRVVVDGIEVAPGVDFALMEGRVRWPLDYARRPYGYHGTRYYAVALTFEF